MTQLKELSETVLQRPVSIPGTAKALHRHLRSQLLDASNRKRITTSPNDIFRLVRLLSSPPLGLNTQLRSAGVDDAYCIVGGSKNQERSEAIDHIRRDDGSWFDFGITVRQHAGETILLAYNFEIRLTPQMGVPFLRFDCNPPHHANDERELRVHIHPGCDDTLLPAPLMLPSELIALLVDGLRRPTDRQERSLTNFERNWLIEREKATRSNIGFTHDHE
jgi:hypothetical protein